MVRHRLRYRLDRPDWVCRDIEVAEGRVQPSAREIGRAPPPDFAPAAPPIDFWTTIGPGIASRSAAPFPGAIAAFWEPRRRWCAAVPIHLRAARHRNPAFHPYMGSLGAYVGSRQPYVGSRRSYVGSSAAYVGSPAEPAGDTGSSAPGLPGSGPAC